MKFYCDSCQTKYSIADEKVRGKVLKVRCKKCSHIITVREAKTPQAAAAEVRSQSPPRAGGAPPPPPMMPKQVEWHYAINGQSFGPFPAAELQKKFASSELGDAVYVWNESFTEWKRVTEVDTFAAALREAAKVRAPARTHGVSGALEAVDVDKVDAAAKKKTEEEEELDSTRIDERVPDDLLQDIAAKARAKKKSSGEAEVKVSKPDPVTSDQARKDRLRTLRDRLQLDESEEIKETPHIKEEHQLFGPGDESEEPNDFAFSETLPDTSERGSDSSQEASVHDGLFSGLGGSGNKSEDLFGASQDHEEEEGEDVVPFFPDAPNLGDAHAPSKSRVDEVTGSLLIQINAIKNDGRKRAIAMSAAIFFGLAAILGGTYFVWEQIGNKEEVEEERKIGLGNIGQAPEFRGYSEEERSKALDQVVNEPVVISREDSRAAYEREESVGEEPAGGQRAAAGSNIPRIDPSTFRREEGELEGSRASDDDRVGSNSRFQPSGLIGSGEGSGTSSGSDLASAGDDLGDDRLNAMAALQTDTQRGIYNPRDEGIDEIQAPQEKLSNQDISDGMQSVGASVGSCRERHILRGGTLEENEVEVTIQINPAGRVENLVLSPSSLEDTDFSRCMHSHTRRWRFRPVTGEGTEARTPFYLQD